MSSPVYRRGRERRREKHYWAAMRYWSDPIHTIVMDRRTGQAQVDYATWHRLNRNMPALDAIAENDCTWPHCTCERECP